MSSQEQNGIDDKPLYDPSLLLELDFENQCNAQYNPKLSPQNPGEGLLMRPLCREDYDKGYIQLLGQLTRVGDISREMFDDRYSKMESCTDSYYITVIEDKSTNQIIGSATLVKEQKFIHECSAKGRIEDVVVNDLYRGKQLGKLLADVSVLLSKKVGCYKTSLECIDKMVPFYKTFGLIKEDGQNYMCVRFHD